MKGVTETAKILDLDGPVRYVDYGGADTGTVFVLVHGLGGSHLNWDLFAPLLTAHGRVVAPDLPGFGLSEPLGRDAGVEANAGVLTRFIREVSDVPVVLVGNSMGGMIAALVASSSPDIVSRVVLLDPAVPPPGAGLGVLGALTVGALEQLHALFPAPRTPRSSRASVELMLRACGVDSATLPADFIARSVALAEEQRGFRGMEKAFRSAWYSMARVFASPSEYRRAMSAISAPVLLVEGTRDRLVRRAQTRDVAARNPHWTYRELEGVGHTPQIEVPEMLVAVLLGWMSRTGEQLAASSQT